jgi:hypothetical protein
MKYMRAPFYIAKANVQAMPEVRGFKLASSGGTQYM